jgi:hypothetical protein
MIKMLIGILGVLTLVIVPNLATAQSHSGGRDNSQVKSIAPTPNPSAYEHADENSKFLRDTEDMGGHQGEMGPKAEDDVKGQDKGDDQGVEKDKGKKKKKSKDKGNSKDSDVKKKNKSVGAEDIDKDRDKEQGAQAEAKKLLEQEHKSEEEEVKY